MAEHDAFESRVSDALLSYAGEMRTRVDAAAVADRVAGERARRWTGVQVPGFGPFPRIAWILVAATLLALAGGIVVVGSGLIDRPRLLDVIANPAISAVAPTRGQGSTVVAGFDGYAWALEDGHLVRVDSAGGITDFGSDVAYLAYRLAPARDGGVWLYGSRHLWRFDGVRRGEVLRPPLEDGSLDTVIDAADGTMWVSSEDGIFRWDGRTWSSVRRPRPDVAAGQMTLDRSGSLWVSEMRYPGPTAEGVSRFDGTNWTNYAVTDTGGSLGIVTGITTDAKGTVWAGLAGWSGGTGLVRFDGSTWTTVPQANLGASATASWAPVVGPTGDVWAVTVFAEGPMRVARHDGRTWTSWGPNDGLPGPDTGGYSDASLAVTADGAFVATQAGLYRLVGDRWERAWPGIEMVAVPRLDLLAVSATEAWGIREYASIADTTEIWHFQGNAVSHETVGESAPAVRDLALAPDGMLWAATDGGVAVRRGGTWTLVDEQPALGVAVASDGTAWVGGKGSKAWTVRPAGAGWEVRDVPDVATGGSTSTEIASWKVGPTMAVDQAGHVWVSGGNQGWFDKPGLLRFDGERWEAMRPVEESGDTVFGNVVAAPDGAVWVTIDATSTAGSCCHAADPATEVARFDGQHWEVLGTANGLPSDNSGLSLAVGPDGAAWLSTNRGLFHFDGKRWSPVLEGEAYGRVSVAPDGALWLAGDSGVARISSPTR